MNATHEIGGLSCQMTEAQAKAWNAGNLTAESLAGATIHLPGPMPEGNGSTHDLWDFIEHSHADVYEKQMEGMPANRIA